MLRAEEAPRALDGAVLMISPEHLITRLQIQRARDDVDARGRVRHEDQMVGLRPYVRREGGARLGEQSTWACQPAAQELDRLKLQLALPALIRVEDWRGAGAIAAMIEERDARPQQVVAPGFGEGGALGRESALGGGTG